MQRINVCSEHNYSDASAQQLGLDLTDGVLRLALANYKTADEIDRTLSALSGCLRAAPISSG